MSSGDETYLIDKWILERLKADSVIQAGVGTRIYEQLAPSDAAYPFIIYQQQTIPRDVQGVGAIRIWTDVHYTIKVVTTGSYANIKALVDRIDDLFDDGTGIQATTTYGHFNCWRVNLFRLTQPINSTTIYRHRGGIYRIQAQSLD